jgi:hypothetical protein
MARRMVVLVVVLLVAPGTWAQMTPPSSEAPPEPSVLNPVIITGTRTECRLADQPDSVSVVTREQLEETPAQLDGLLASARPGHPRALP